MKIAIYGSAEEENTELTNQLKQFGEEIAKRGHTVVTGACPGIPFYVAESAYLTRANVIGFSPFTDLLNHKKSGEPYNCFSELKFIPRNYELKNNIQACYKYRNISSVIYADAIVIISGRIGTLNEFTNAYEFGKKIYILQGTGGVADCIKEIMKNIKKETGAKIFYYNDFQSLKKDLLKE
ncbi:MAG: hypothetical protein KAS15_06370 [Nanoarchaeota archaeon]|nr:hypothetical protein [Nanoarchaeota archaeon]